MTEQDKSEFSKSLAQVAAVFDKTLTPFLIDAYFDALADFPLDRVATALRQAISIKTFFPRPAEIRELIEGSGDDRANQAWAAFMQAVSDGGNASVKFLDPAAASAVDSVFGSYLQAARSIHIADEPMVAHYRKAFCQAYQTARKFPRQVETYRAGVFEFANSGGGAWADRVRIYTGPIRLIGTREVKEVRLPFDATTGRLTEQARLMVDAASTPEGAMQLIAAATVRAPQLPPAQSGEPLNHGEAKALLKQIEQQTGVKVELKTMEAAQ